MNECMTEALYQAKQKDYFVGYENREDLLMIGSLKKDFRMRVDQLR